ncbi:MAG: hypothetical protein PWQ67_582 [Clostridia bacterium]|jgi:uncharacterized membrane protein|nr:hypothetical protein [Clostridia bacterium]MDN5322128.1 hypothetical protein [Clostridia bacterium]
MFSFDSQELQIILLSALPLTELRLSIPLAVALGIGPLKAFLLACLGNFLPIVPFLLLLQPVNRLIIKIPFIKDLFIKFLKKTRAKGEKVEKYGALGLLLFVAIPFPGTGVYSGAILAFLFGIRFWYAFPALTIGMIFAGIAVTLASAGVKEMAQYIYNLEYFIVIILALGIIFLSWRKKHKKG